MKSISIILLSCFLFACSSKQQRVSEEDVLDYDANSDMWQRSLEKNYFKFYHTDYGPSLVKTVELESPLISAAVARPTSVVYLLKINPRGQFKATPIKKAALPYQELCEVELKSLRFEPASMAQNKLPSFVYLIFHFKAESR